MKSTKPGTTQPINKPKVATMKDVAALADVSLMTVSRVLNNDSKVSKDTRTRVLKAVEELNYRINFSARSLSSTQSFVIAVFYDNAVGSFITEYIIGTLQRCNDLGYHLVIEHCDSNSTDLEEQVRNLVERYTLDGIIIAPPLGDNIALLNALEEYQLTYVRVGPGFELHRAAYVAIDDYKAAFAMTELLIKQGHKKIGFIKGDPSQGVSHSRLRGFIDAMHKHKLDVSEKFIAEGNFSFTSGMAAAQQLLKISGITAIFASNDDMAAAVVAVAHKKHIDIPSELSVAGFDDTYIATNIWPQLTTIQQPIKDMAIEAVNLLITIIKSNFTADTSQKNATQHNTSQHKKNRESKILEHAIIERESVGRVRKPKKS